MKTKISYSLIAVALACGLAQAQTTAYTTPVGYYNFDAKSGGNFFIPGFVNSTAFAGQITAAGAFTLTVAPSQIVAGAYNKGAVYSTHYVEITQAGSNQGIVINIESNTNSVITLDRDITLLGLVGTETIAIRPHVTLASAFSSAEATVVQFTDSATFYNANGSTNSYFLVAPGQWSSDFVNNDGTNRPIPPGTGVVLDVFADAALTVVGTVKSSATVVEINGGGVVNVVGPVNPLVGSGDLVKNLGFANMLPFTDSLTVYAPGSIIVPTATYFADGAGNVTTDFVNSSLGSLLYTNGGFLNAQDNTSLRINSGL